LKYLLSIIFLINVIFLYSQKDHYSDSLKNILKKEISDSLRASIYIDLTEHFNDEKDWLPYNEKALSLANKKLKTTKGAEQRYYYLIKAHATGNLGYYYDYLGQKEKTIKYYFESLELYDKAGSKEGKATIYSNLGVIFTNQGDYKEAEDYLKKALILKKQYDPKNVAKNYINLGVLYENEKDTTLAMEYYQKALVSAKKIDAHDDIATSLNNIGSFYYHNNQYEKAIPFLSKAVDECYLADDEPGAAWIMANLGNAYLNLKRLDSAGFFLLKAKEISDRSEYLELKQNIAEKLYEYYAVQDDYKKALEQYKFAVELGDKINDIASQKEGIRQKMTYDHQKEKERIQLIRKEEQKREAQRTIFILIALVLIFIIAIVMYSRFKTARKQKLVIEGQKKIVEEKNKEITDSINYAKYLQSAILPERLTFFNGLSDGFLFYRPKDLVAGDFYWKHENEEFIYFAVADCTGHGVPGALVSVVCYNALEKSIQEKSDIDTSFLLDRTREIVIKQFETEEREVKDGMDIAVIQINKNTNELTFSGAHNSCWINREGEWITLKGDRQPIGKYEYATPFESQSINCKSGDWIYLFSDGITDQFGGEQGKKLRNKGLQQFLESFTNETGKQRENSFDSFFNNWKGNLDQIDDVCVMGIKLI